MFLPAGAPSPMNRSKPIDGERAKKIAIQIIQQNQQAGEFSGLRLGIQPRIGEKILKFKYLTPRLAIEWE